MREDRMSLRQGLGLRGRTLGMAFGLVGMLSGAAAAQDAPKPDAPKPNSGKMTLTAAYDFSNVYMFRGIRQDDTKLIMWPAADLNISLYSGEGGLKSAYADL